MPETGWAGLTPAKHIFPSVPSALVKNTMEMGHSKTPRQEHQAILGPTHWHHSCGARDVHSGLSGPDLMTVGAHRVGKETWLWLRPHEAKQATGGVCCTGLVFSEEMSKRA